MENSDKLSGDISAIVEDVLNDADLHPADIPAIDLYLDQILSLFSDCMAKGSPRYADKPLTKTMVNNYSKDGLIKPVKGKKYAKEHIVQMLLVYALKSTMSIGEIKRLLCGVDTLPDFGGDDLIACYERYLADKDFTRAHCRALVDELQEKLQLNLADDRDFMVFLLCLLSVSSYTDNIARALLADRYPDPDDAEKQRLEAEKLVKEQEREREREEERRRKEEERQRKENETAEKIKEKELRAERAKNENVAPAAVPATEGNK